MLGDPYGGLFKRRLEIDMPGGVVAENARKLALRGLLRVEERVYVLCMNPLDHDQWRVKEMSCTGRIYLSRDRDEDNGDYQCPDCGRCVYPSRKCPYMSIRLFPKEEAMRQFVHKKLAARYARVEERPTGVYRIPVATGDVSVCLVDVCAEPRVFREPIPYREKLLCIIGNDRDYLRQVPEDIPRFRLAELALAGVSSNFHRALRRVAGGVVAAPTPSGPFMTALSSSGVIYSFTHESERAEPGPVRIRVPRGTGWSQIKMFLVDGETLAIRVPGQRQQRYLCQQLGMTDKRNGKPTKKWEILERLCEEHGVIPWTHTASTFDAFKEQVSGLRRTLQEIFGIKANPFLECSQSSGLRAAFQAFPDLPDSRPSLPHL